MSEDGSPAGGRQQPSQDFDQNSSLIEKVRSRVTSIIPQSFSKWFSPTAGEDGSRNGAVRRRRDETALDDEESYRQEEDSDGDEDDTVVRAPPMKRSRLNVSEDNAPSDSFQITQTSSFMSSTPTTIGRRKHLGLLSVHQPSIDISPATSSAISARSISTTRSSNDVIDTDILEVIPEHRDVNYEFTRQTSSRRSLNIPTTRDLRRSALSKFRTGGELSPAPFRSAAIRSSFLQNEDDDDNQDVFNAEGQGNIDKIITNGVRSSPNIISLDTASESGESQSSSIQKTKTSSLFGAGAKRLRTSAGSGLNYATHLQGKKSLFCDKNMPSHLNNSTTSLTSLNRRQSFNASLYGSTSALSDSRLLNTFSPFYKGYTTYGGAAAYSKYSKNVQRATIRTPTLIGPSSSLSTLSSSTASLSQAADTTSALSNTAKRILELMNQFTTPLADAKKMANNTKVPTLTAHRQRFGDLDRTANRGIRMSMPKTPYSRPSSSTATNESKQSLAPPINELQVPSMSQLLQLKKLQNNTEKVREITNQSKSVLNRKEEYKLPTDSQTDERSSAKHINKIKNKLTSTRSSAKSGLGSSDEPVHSVDLPDIPLPMLESVPKIDIAISKVSSNKQSSKNTTLAPAQQGSQPQVTFNSTSFTNTSSALSSTSIFSSSLTTLSKSPQSKSAAFITNNSTQNESNAISTGAGFKFSPPIEVASSLAKNNVEPISNFKFSDPFPVSSLSTDSIASDNFKFQHNNNNKQLKMFTPSSPTNVLTAGIPVATQLKTGSVLDAFKKSPTAEKIAAPSFGSQFKMSADKWECSMCMVRNENSAEKCVACETARKIPKAVASSQLLTNQPKLDIKNTFGDKFKPSSDTWECSTCMIRNKSDVVKCVACETMKPGQTKSQPAAAILSSVPKTTNAGFKSLVAQQSAKWECSACMTRNESIRNKCVCCEQTKPGAVSDSAPQFSFGASASKFTFGFAGKKEEELKSDSTSKTAASSLTSASETKSGFSFGVKPSTSSSTGTVPSGTPSFSFGAATATTSKDETDKSAVSAPTFKFGVSEQKTKIELLKTNPEIKTLDKKLPESTSFKFESPATSPSSVPVQGDSKGSSSGTPSSIFKPIGGLAFGGGDKKSGEPVKPIFGSSAVKLTADASKSTPALGGFSLTNSSLSTKSETATSKSKPLFAFESSAALGGDNKSAESSASFSFGTSASTSAFKSPLPQKSTSDLAAAGTKIDLSAAPTFVFGKSSAPASATPTFGAISSNAITSSSSSNAVTTAPSFGGSVSSVSSSNSSSFGKSASNLGPAVLAPSFGTSTPAAVPQQNKFGNSSFSASNSSTTDNPSNLYAFGGAANKPETVTPMFGNVSSTTVTSNKLFTFGGGANASTASPSAAAATTTASSTPFLFGAASTQKPTETTATPIFGSAHNNTAAAPLPAFGSFSSPLPTPQQQQSHVPTFGQPSSISSPFGANLNNAPPVFGSAVTPATSVSMFGSAIPSAPVPTFGSTTSAFGATNNSTFGSSAPKTTFGNGFGASAPSTGGDPVAKKPVQGFNFGAPAPPQNSTGVFSFGSNNNNNNNNNNKQPFAFSASSAPAFNFTGSSETATNAPFQFSAAQAANNMFAVTPGAPQTAQPLRRKPRTVTRRTQQR